MITMNHENMGAENVNALRHIGMNLLKQEKAARWKLLQIGKM